MILVGELRVAAVGDRIFVSVFGLIGADRFRVDSDEEFRSTITDLVKRGEYSMIIVPERYLDLTREIRSELIAEGRIEPIFAFVPEKGLNKRVEELKELVSLAVGLRLEI
ncbi:MAG: hypothetical protein DRN60_03350 [Thaumarchaeota archaeon]|nr:MAG: hypothetical protein DRN60_03350 [Nitrososphaerota archaeon]